MEAFDKFSSDLHQQVAEIAPWAPPDYTRAKLEALAHNPEIALAWDLRNVDGQAAKRELMQAQVLLARPPDGTTPQQMAELQNYGTRLQIAVNSHAILRKAVHGILSDARKVPKPIDEQVTADRELVSQTLRHAGIPVDFKEAPPDFGNMTDNELRQYTKQFGF